MAQNAISARLGDWERKIRASPAHSVYIKYGFSWHKSAKLGFVENLIIMVIIRILLAVCLPLVQCILSYNAFDDSMLYDISWSGPLRSRHQVQVN